MILYNELKYLRTMDVSPELTTEQIIKGGDEIKCQL